MFHPDGNRLGRRGIFYLPQAIATSEFQALLGVLVWGLAFFQFKALKLRSLKVTALLNLKTRPSGTKSPSPGRPGPAGRGTGSRSY